MKKLIFLFILFAAAMPFYAQDSLPLTEVSEIGASNCITKLGFGKNVHLIIKNETELSEAIRNDASRERCIALLNEQNISFNTHILVGAGIYSGGCYRPAGLNAELQTDYAESKAEVAISYEMSTMQCKAYKIYYAWYLVPKPLEGFNVGIKFIERKDKESGEF